MSKIPKTLCPDLTLKWCYTGQNMFCNFCYQTKNGGSLVSLFCICVVPMEKLSQNWGTSFYWKASFKSPWCFLNIKWAEFKYNIFAIFFEIITEQEAMENFVFPDEIPILKKMQKEIEKRIFDRRLFLCERALKLHFLRC